MSYQMGDRRFPWFFRFFDDPQGHEPREVSESPIQPIIPVAPATGSMVMAWAEELANTASAFWDAISWDFSNGAYDSGLGYLPSDRFWEIVMIGSFSTTNNHYVKVTPGVQEHASIYSPPTQSITEGPFTATGGPYERWINEMQGLKLPYGGKIEGRLTAAGGSWNITAFAVGYLHGTSDIP